MDEPQDKPTILEGGTIYLGKAKHIEFEPSVADPLPLPTPLPAAGGFTFAMRVTEEQVITGCRKDGHTHVTVREATDDDRAQLAANLEAVRQFLDGPAPAGPQETA